MNLAQDEKKIENRVNLLQREEKRILKKINETRARAEKISFIKEKNEKDYQEKIKRKMEAEERLKLRRQLNAQEKDYAKQRRQEIKEISNAIKKNEY